MTPLYGLFEVTSILSIVITGSTALLATPTPKQYTAPTFGQSFTEQISLKQTNNLPFQSNLPPLPYSQISKPNLLRSHNQNQSNFYFPVPDPYARDALNRKNNKPNSKILPKNLKSFRRTLKPLKLFRCISKVKKMVWMRFVSIYSSTFEDYRFGTIKSIYTHSVAPSTQIPKPKTNSKIYSRRKPPRKKSKTSPAVRSNRRSVISPGYRSITSRPLHSTSDTLTLKKLPQKLSSASPRNQESTFRTQTKTSLSVLPTSEIIKAGLIFPHIPFLENFYSYLTLTVKPFLKNQLAQTTPSGLKFSEAKNQETTTETFKTTAAVSNTQTSPSTQFSDVTGLKKNLQGQSSLDTTRTEPTTPPADRVNFKTTITIPPLLGAQQTRIQSTVATSSDTGGTEIPSSASTATFPPLIISESQTNPSKTQETHATQTTEINQLGTTPLAQSSFYTSQTRKRLSTKIPKDIVKIEKIFITRPPFEKKQNQRVSAVSAISSNTNNTDAVLSGDTATLPPLIISEYRKNPVEYPPSRIPTPPTQTIVSRSKSWRTRKTLSSQNTAPEQFETSQTQKFSPTPSEQTPLAQSSFYTFQTLPTELPKDAVKIITGNIIPPLLGVQQTQIDSTVATSSDIDSIEIPSTASTATFPPLIISESQTNPSETQETHATQTTEINQLGTTPLAQTSFYTSQTPQTLSTELPKDTVKIKTGATMPPLLDTQQIQIDSTVATSSDIDSTEIPSTASTATHPPLIISESQTNPSKTQETHATQTTKINQLGTTPLAQSSFYTFQTLPTELPKDAVKIITGNIIPPLLGVQQTQIDSTVATSSDIDSTEILSSASTATFPPLIISESQTNPSETQETHATQTTEINQLGTTPLAQSSFYISQTPQTLSTELPKDTVKIKTGATIPPLLDTPQTQADFTKFISLETKSSFVTVENPTSFTVTPSSENNCRKMKMSLMDYFLYTLGEIPKPARCLKKKKRRNLRPRPSLKTTQKIPPNLSPIKMFKKIIENFTYEPQTILSTPLTTDGFHLGTVSASSQTPYVKLYKYSKGSQTQKTSSMPRETERDLITPTVPPLETSDGKSSTKATEQSLVTAKQPTEKFLVHTKEHPKGLPFFFSKKSPHVKNSTETIIVGYMPNDDKKKLQNFIKEKLNSHRNVLTFDLTTIPGHTYKNGLQHSSDLTRNYFNERLMKLCRTYGLTVEQVKLTQLNYETDEEGELF